MRILEIVVYQINVLFFDPYENKHGKQKYALRGYRRIIILTLHNYLEIIFWFSSFYLHLRALFNDQYGVLNNLWGAIYYSVVTITTLGYGEVFPCSNFTRILVALQTVIGVCILAIIVTRIIAYLPKPMTLNNKEK